MKRDTSVRYGGRSNASHLRRKVVQSDVVTASPGDRPRELQTLRWAQNESSRTAMTPEAVLSPASTSLPWVAHYPASASIGTCRSRQARSRTFWTEPLGNFPDNPAISFLGRVTTYADLAAEVDRVAAGLQKIGVKRGTKVGIFLPNTPTFIVYYFAILKAGGTVVNFNPAIYFRGADLSGERQRDRDHGHARSRDALFQDRRR